MAEALLVAYLPLASSITRESHHHPVRHLKIVQLLYECGGDVDAEGRDGRTPLAGIVRHALDTLKLFNDCSIMVQIQITRIRWPDFTAYAPFFRHVEVSWVLLQYTVAQLLLEHGADMNA